MKDGGSPDGQPCPATIQSDSVALLARHDGLLRRTARVVLGSAALRDPGLVDDAVQDVAVRLLHSGTTCRDAAALPAFLAALARAAALDILRGLLRHRARTDRVARLSVQTAGADGDPSTAAERSIAAAEVMRLLDDLPEPDRSLVYLRDAEGLDITSLARTFGLPAGTIKSKLHRARARIKARALRIWGDC